VTLPTGWVETTLGEIARLRTGPFGSAVHKSDYILGGVPLINPMHIVDGKIRPSPNVTISKAKAEQLIEFRLKAGDVLIGRRGEMGRCAVVQLTDAGCLIGTGSMAVTPSDAIGTEYLRRLLASPDVVAILEGNSVGSTMVNLNQGILQRLPVSLPPLAEQRRIVAKLDTLTARLRRARTELDRVATMAKAMRLAALKTIFDRFEDKTQACIDSVCKVGTGSTPKRGHAPFYEDGHIPWVTSGVVNQGIVSQPTEYITQAAIRETNCKVFPAGSLLVALYGEGKTRGKVATLQIGAATNQALAVLHDFDKARVIPRWIEFFLLGRYEETREQAAGGVQPNLNLGIVKAIMLPLPPIVDQTIAILTLELAFARADRLEAEAARARALLDRLEAAILARAFRGELVPQDPTDEPATALLNRIREARAATPKPKRGRRAMAEADSNLYRE
jgi:type I restriction enzyme, S subunit